MFTAVHFLDDEVAGPSQVHNYEEDTVEDQQSKNCMYTFINLLLLLYFPDLLLIFFLISSDLNAQHRRKLGGRSILVKPRMYTFV